MWGVNASQYVTWFPIEIVFAPWFSFGLSLSISKTYSWDTPVEATGVLEKKWMCLPYALCHWGLSPRNAGTEGGQCLWNGFWPNTGVSCRRWEAGRRSDPPSSIRILRRSLHEWQASVSLTAVFVCLGRGLGKSYIDCRGLASCIINVTW